jgi:hypothetical protein
MRGSAIICGLIVVIAMAATAYAGLNSGASRPGQAHAAGVDKD